MRACKVERCRGKHAANGYCIKHYMQMRRYGKILKRTSQDPNEIIIKGDIAEIVLYDKHCNEKARAVIDAEDVDKVKNYKWYLSTVYVQTTINKKKVRIQHIILGTNSNRKDLIDHKNRNPLINRKYNLRACTHAENMRNSKHQKNNTSGYRGVIWYKPTKKWRAQIGVNGKLRYLGYFVGILDAARAYNTAALRYHGEFACLNKL